MYCNATGSFPSETGRPSALTVNSPAIGFMLGWGAVPGAAIILYLARGTMLDVRVLEFASSKKFITPPPNPGYGCDGF